MKKLFLMLVALSLLAVPVFADGLGVTGDVAGKAKADHGGLMIGAEIGAKADAELSHEAKLAIVKNLTKERREANKEIVAQAPSDSKELRVEAKEKREELKEKVSEKIKENREKLREDGAKMREQMQARIEKLSEIALKTQAKFDARIGKFDEKTKRMREDLFEKSNKSLEKIEARLDKLKERKGSLNESEKRELNATIDARLTAEIDKRINMALFLEIKGADSALVKNFTDFATLKKAELANATTVAQKKAIIGEVNRKWAEFRQKVADDLFKAKLELGLNKSNELLLRLNSVIAQLKERGLNTSKLENQSASISVLINETANANLTIKQASARLSRLHVALVHLKNSIYRVINQQFVEDLREAREEREDAREILKEAKGEARVKVSAEVAAALGAGFSSAQVGSTAEADEDANENASASVSANASA